MARPIKEGLDYFPLDVDIDQDDKIALIEATHGLEGFGAVIKLLMKIYDNSYYYEWGEKEQLLFSRRVNVNINRINDIINDCLKWGLFSKELFEQHQILSSKGIQKRYLEATTRRKEVRIRHDYLLLNNKEVNAYKNLVVVNINPVNDDIGTQSKVKESNKEEGANDEDPIITLLINNGIVHPGGINYTLMEDLNDITSNFGFVNSEQMIEEAIKDAARGNGKTWKFVYNKLVLWRKQGIKNLEDLENARLGSQSKTVPFTPKQSKFDKNKAILDKFRRGEA
jgi:DNA replication protein DnaD